MLNTINSTESFANGQTFLVEEIPTTTGNTNAFTYAKLSIDGFIAFSIEYNYGVRNEDRYQSALKAIESYKSSKGGYIFCDESSAVDQFTKLTGFIIEHTMPSNILLFESDGKRYINIEGSIENVYYNFIICNGGFFKDALKKRIKGFKNTYQRPCVLSAKWLAEVENNVNQPFH